MTLREDVVKPSLPIEEVQAMAPAWLNGYFVVPAIMAREE